MSFLDRFQELPPCDPARYWPFRAAGMDVGMMRPEFAQFLEEFPDVFRVNAGSVHLNDALVDFDERTRAVDRVLRILAGRGVIPGWREEPYPVGLSFDGPVLFTMERAAVPLFGVQAYGVHMNGYVEDGGGLKMWVARRSLNKGSAPGKLDQMVAGGQPAGISLADNLAKECGEEAAIPRRLAAKAVPVSTLRYCTLRPEGVRRDVLFNYDLELPADFRPHNTDGEVEEFYLWPIGRVIETVRDTDEFKFNCALVAIDFLMRRGLIPPDHAEYAGLRETLDS